MGELVLITGTSSGIGLSAAVECAAAGHRVVATMRDLTRRKGLIEAAEARAVSVDVEQLDVTSAGAAAKIRELTLKYGPIYALVNNAGIAFGGPFEEQSEADVRQQFETNVFGMMAVTRAVLPSMRAAERGRIINVSSLSGRIALPLVSVYAATKHAVEGFSESLRWEVEPFGIEVCVVEPGTLKTAIFAGHDGGRPLIPPGPGGHDGGTPPPSGPGGHDGGRPPMPPGPGGHDGGRPPGPAGHDPPGNLRRRAYVSATGPYAALSEAVEKLVVDDADKAPPADAVGKAIAALVADPAPRFRSLIGIDARTLVTLRRMVPDRLFASGIRRLLHLQRSR